MRYKVKDSVISILLKNNTMATAGQEVDEEQLTDTPTNLINGGFIEEIIVPGPSAAELQQQADAQKALELSNIKIAVDNAKTSVDNATNALTAAQTAAAAATPETKDALDAAVVSAQADLNTAQAAFDAIAPKSGKK